MGRYKSVCYICLYIFKPRLIEYLVKFKMDNLCLITNGTFISSGENMNHAKYLYRYIYN